MNTNMNSTAKRPKTVWVILIWNILSITIISISLWSIYSGAIPLKPKSAAYFNSLTFIEHFFTATLIFLNLSGTIALFLLKKISVPLLFSALAINVLWNLIENFVSHQPTTSGPGSFIGTLIGLGISLAICIYALRLRTNGVLA